MGSTTITPWLGLTPESPEPPRLVSSLTSHELAVLAGRTLVVGWPTLAARGRHAELRSQPAAAGRNTVQTPSQLVAHRLRRGAAIAVLAVGAIVILGTLAYRSGQIGPPHDFPVYPGSQLTSFNTFFHPSGRQDRIIWEAPDPQAQVQAFYDIHLNEGDWEATATDPRTGTIGFQRRSSVRTHGLLTMLTHGQQTRIEVEIDS